MPAIDTASSTAAIRSLGKRGVRTVAIASDESVPGFASRHCDETVTVPDPSIDLDGYEEAVLELARRPGIETILPFREADVYVLARNKATLTEHVGTPWPSLETLRGAQDRVKLFDAARAAGVATPETRTLDDWDDWDRDLVVKPRYTVQATEYANRFGENRNVETSTQYVDADDHLDRDEVVAGMDHVPLVQEYVPTADEYGFFAMYDHGEPVATFQHLQRRGWKYCGGPSAYRESVDIPDLEAAGLDLLDELDWHGVAMVEFLRDPDTGEFRLMEVNPRFWSSLPFTVQAGVDFPALYWQRATGRSMDLALAYEVGIAGHLLRGELLHLHSILADDYPLVDRPSFPRTALAVAASLVRHPRFDYLDASDLGPFVQEVANLFGELSNSGTDGPTADPTDGRPAGLHATFQTLLRR